MNITAGSRTPLEIAFTALLIEVFRFNGQLLSVGDALGRDLGLTSARWQVVSSVREAPLSVAHIARNMGLTRQAVQRVVNQLAVEKLIAFTDNPHHRRAKLVALTADGRAALEAVISRHERWVNEVAAGFDPQAIQAAAETITRLRDCIDKRGERHETDRPVLRQKERQR